jgi:hypothetical protein
MTKVCFRKTKDGEITAVFPFEPWNLMDFSVTCYVHLGQHGSCCWEWVRGDTRPATEAESVDLLSELKRIGYDDLQVLRRLPNWSKIVKVFWPQRKTPE